MTNPNIPRTDDIHEVQNWQIRIENAKKDVAQLLLDVAAAQASIVALETLTGVFDPTDQYYQLGLEGTVSGGLLLKKQGAGDLGAISAGTGGIAILNANQIAGSDNGGYVNVSQDSNAVATAKCAKFRVGRNTGTDDAAVIELLTIYSSTTGPGDPPSGSGYIFFYGSGTTQRIYFRINDGGTVETSYLTLPWSI